ncbi:MAG: hypothetical protein K9G59_01635 [Caulobacter sp.]|nr:hypothetical protein [Caulobacter sp.]
MRTSVALAAVAALAFALPSVAPTAAMAQSAAVSATCSSLYTSSTAVLGTSATVGPASVGYPGMANVQGCQIGFSGDGTVFPGTVQAIAGKLDAMMLGGGWTRDPNADADGPGATAAGYKKDGQLVAVSVSWEPAAGVCSADAPLASCHTTPAQKLFTITLGVMAGS